MSDPTVTCTIDLGGSGKQIGHLAIPKITNTAGWASTFVHIGSVANGDGPTVLVLAGNHGDEYEGAGRRAPAPPGAAAGAGLGTGDRDPGALAGRIEGEHAELAVRCELQPLLPWSSRRPAERAARRLPHARALPARGRRHRHALGRPQRLVPPLLPHARRRRPRAASGDARGHGGMVQRLALPLHRRERHGPAPGRGREPGQARDHHRARRRRARSRAGARAGMERAHERPPSRRRARGRGRHARLAGAPPWS